MHSALGPWTEGLHAKLQLRGGESSSTAPGSSAVTFASPYRVVVEADSCPVERGEMSEAEARSIVQSIVCMDDVVVFSRGAPRAGDVACVLAMNYFVCAVSSG